MKTRSSFQQGRRAWLPWLSVAVIAFGCAGVRGGTSESVVKKSFSVEPGGVLDVEADQGSIEIQPGESKTLVAEVERIVRNANASQTEDLLAGHELSFDQDGNKILIRSKVGKQFSVRFGRRPELEVRLRIRVPSQFNLTLRTAAGSISGRDQTGDIKATSGGGSLRFGNVNGRFDASTAAGSIKLAGATGPVSVKTSGGSLDLGSMEAETRAETSAGSMTIKATKARLTAKSSGGSIKASELSGPTTLETSAGSIQVELAHGDLHVQTGGGSIKLLDLKGTTTAQTSAGSITASFSAQPPGACRLTSSGGSINVSLNSELAFDLDADTGAGSLKTDIPVTATVKGDSRSGRLRGTINGGGKLLEIKTSAGGISIKKL